MAVVTGAAGAMGAACARSMITVADRLLLTDCDDARLDAEAERIAAATGVAIATVVGDIAHPRFVAELATRAAAIGEVHAVVHTAGVSPSMAGWEQILHVDLAGSARLLDAFLPVVVPGTVAVCIASIAGLMGAFTPEMDAVLDAPLVADFSARFRSQFGSEPDPGSTYRLAKRGVIRLCERAAVAWGARGGRVVSLSPGLIDTAMGRLELEHNAIKVEMARRTPIRSTRQSLDAVLPGAVADIADVVTFLCSERASFLSGCDVRVDGGLIGAMQAPG